MGATTFIRSQNCYQVGLLLDQWEYPFWVLLQQTNKMPVHISHVGVVNNSAAKSEPGSSEGLVCAVVSVDYQAYEPTSKSGPSLAAWMDGPVKVLLTNTIAVSNPQKVDEVGSKEAAAYSPALYSGK
jgi:hypothetical protein